MTVGQLIAELKKMPQDNIVYYQDFDSDDYGMSSAVNSVEIRNYDNLNEQQQEQNEFKLTGNIVYLKG